MRAVNCEFLAKRQENSPPANLAKVGLNSGANLQTFASKGYQGLESSSLRNKAHAINNVRDICRFFAYFAANFAIVCREKFLSASICAMNAPISLFESTPVPFREFGLKYLC
jgi:hypothetical protein